MTGIILRVVLAAVFIVAAVRMLVSARATRAHWRRREAGITRAEVWWRETHGGPFDQERTAVPDDVAAYLGVNGPRTDLRSPRPAQAETVWGWLLVGLAVLLLITVAAQVASGLT